MDIDGLIRNRYDSEKLEKAFLNNDRTALPGGFFRVTAGTGGESYLITAYEKTVLYDTGMAYCGDRLTENIKKILDGRKLDIVVLSHTHYDHVGALPFVRRAFPEITVCGSAYGQYIFTRPGAIKMMMQLSRKAEVMFGEEGQNKCFSEGLAIDRALTDGEKIDLGTDESGQNRGSLKAIECKGHTDCSMAYMIEPDSVMFASESTGVPVGWDANEIAILKGYDESMKSAEKCRKLHPEHIIAPHYGPVPAEYRDAYWDVFCWNAEDQKEFVSGLLERGMGYEEIMKEFEKRYWSDRRMKSQPKEAFLENAKNIVKMYIMSLSKW